MQYPINCHFNKYGNCVSYEYLELWIFVAVQSVNDENLKSGNSQLFDEVIYESNH